MVLQFAATAWIERDAPTYRSVESSLIEKLLLFTMYVSRSFGICGFATYNLSVATYHKCGRHSRTSLSNDHKNMLLHLK